MVLRKKSCVCLQSKKHSKQHKIQSQLGKGNGTSRTRWPSQSQIRQKHLDPKRELDLIRLQEVDLVAELAQNR